ncbi:hypothetical protein DFH28DRAFT_1131506 [Melampsora americana]|nr:hypothetical protein DFH28DRAFT_1131506 [Melampsora americana]
MQELSRFASRSRGDFRQSSYQLQEEAFQHPPQKFNGLSVTWYAPCKVGDGEWITDPQLAMPDAWLGQVRLFQKETDAREWVTAHTKAIDSVPVIFPPRKEPRLVAEAPWGLQDKSFDCVPGYPISQVAYHGPGKVSSYTSFSGEHRLPTGSKLNPDAKSYVPLPSLAKANMSPEANMSSENEKQLHKAAGDWEMNQSRDEDIESAKKVGLDEPRRKTTEIGNPQTSRSTSIASEENIRAYPNESKSDQTESSEPKEVPVQTLTQNERDKELEMNFKRKNKFEKAFGKGQLRLSKTTSHMTESVKKEAKGSFHSSDKMQSPRIAKWMKKKKSSVSPQLEEKEIAARQEGSKGKAEIIQTLMKGSMHEELPDLNPSVVMDDSHTGHEYSSTDSGTSDTIIDTKKTEVKNADDMSLLVGEGVEMSSKSSKNPKKPKKKSQKSQAKLSDKKSKKTPKDGWDDILINSYSTEVNSNRRLSIAKILHNVLKSENKQDFMSINLSDEAFNSLSGTQTAHDPSSIVEDLDTYQAEFAVLIGKPESYRRFKALKAQITQKMVTKNWKELKDKCDRSVKNIVRSLGGTSQWPVFYTTKDGQTERILANISQLTPQQKAMLQSVIDVDEQENRLRTMYTMEQINKEYVPKIFTEKKLQLLQKQGVSIPLMLKMEQLLHLTSPFEYNFMKEKEAIARTLDVMDVMEGNINMDHGEALMIDDIEWINSPVRKCFIEENEHLKAIFENCLWILATHVRGLSVPLEALYTMETIIKDNLKTKTIPLDWALIATHFGISYQELAEIHELQADQITAVFEGYSLEETLLKISSKASRDKWVQLNAFVKRLKDKLSVAIEV